jgi:probable serine/threonine-protein kinase clkA|nr:MAG TPA: hypothetical protein [Caudoviricetes sp.]
MALGKGNQQGNYGYQGGNNNGNYNNGNNYQNNGQPRRESWGLWVNQSKSGKEYLSFEINGVKYVAFENTNKTSEKSPDYNIVKKDSLQQNNGGSFRNNNSGYNTGGYQNGYNPNNGYSVPQNNGYTAPQNNGYTPPQQGSEGGSSRNTNVGADEPQNETYSPSDYKGLTL